MRFCFGHVLPEEWPEACGSLTVVGAGTKHGFGTDPIRNPTIWLVALRGHSDTSVHLSYVPHALTSSWPLCASDLIMHGASSLNPIMTWIIWF